VTSIVVFLIIKNLLFFLFLFCCHFNFTTISSTTTFVVSASTETFTASAFIDPEKSRP
jgi:hypothetical protein